MVPSESWREPDRRAVTRRGVGFKMEVSVAGRELAWLGVEPVPHSRSGVQDGDRVSDERYVREVFEASYRRLMSQLYAVTGDAAEAEDAVCEAFARACAAGARFRGLDNPEAWLRTVAVNIVRTRWRRARLFRQRAGKLAPPTALPGISEDHVAVMAALRRLPHGQREVVALHYFGDLAVADVADTLGLPVGTVKSRLKRARDALRDLLQENPGEEVGHG